MKCIAEVHIYVKGFQERRAQVAEEIVDSSMKIPAPERKANPDPKRPQPTSNEQHEDAGGCMMKLMKNQEKKLLNEGPPKERLVETTYDDCTL